MPVTPPPSSGSGGGSVVFYDEGSAIGTGTLLNFVGAGVAGTFSGGTAIATIAAGTGAFTFSGARGTASGTLNLNNGSFTDVTFTGTDEYDTDAYHDPGSNPNRFTVPATGKYRVVWSAKFSAGGATETHLLLQKNTATGVANALAGTSYQGNMTVAFWMGTAWEGSLTSGDYVKLEAYVDSASKNLALHWLTIARLDP